jgi:uncharacterized protein
MAVNLLCSAVEKNHRCEVFKGSLLLLLMLISGVAQSASFHDAQQAATRGDYDEVVRVITALVEQGGLSSQEEVIAYANRGVAYSLLKSYEASRADLLHVATIDPGHLLTRNHLGILSEHVDGDYNVAAGHYRLAADVGYAPSMTNLGTLYLDGKGVPQDDQKAFSLFQQAASQEYMMAYVPLGMMFQQGRGTRQDYASALQWIGKGADAGVISAHYHLGRAYERGLGISQDYKQAANEYTLAAMQGHGQAQNALGYLYRRGNGVETDYVKAAQWYQLASDQGIVQATNRLAWLLATCPHQQVCNGKQAANLLPRRSLRNGPRRTWTRSRRPMRAMGIMGWR